jgi:hypothetical protein
VEQCVRIQMAVVAAAAAVTVGVRYGGAVVARWCEGRVSWAGVHESNAATSDTVVRRKDAVGRGA